MSVSISVMDKLALTLSVLYSGYNRIQFISLSPASVLLLTLFVLGMPVFSTEFICHFTPNNSD